VRSAIIDFEDERARHEQLFGREDVIAMLLGRLHKLPCGWVLLLGGPGAGKSAIVAHTLKVLPDAPHHFVRRGIEGWDRPEVIVQNLCAQLERRYGEEVDEALPEERRLGDLLKRISKKHVLTSSNRLILVIDGLDEVASDGASENPLFRYLPQSVPGGVVFLATSRQMHVLPAHLQENRRMPIDLDDPLWASSNKLAARAIWEHHAEQFDPPLDAAFVDEAVERGGGNLLHATKLCDWLRDQPESMRVTANIPKGLFGLLERIWDQIDRLPSPARERIVKGLGLACAALEPLSGAHFRMLCGGDDLFLREIRPFLCQETAHWNQCEHAYRLFHTSFRDFIVARIGEGEIRKYHQELAQTIAAWPPEAQYGTGLAYGARHAVDHRLACGDVRGAYALCLDVGYLEAKCREVGLNELENDVNAVSAAMGRDKALDLIPILAAVRAEAPRLQQGGPAHSLAGLLYNRLRCVGWSCERIEGTLHFPDGLPSLRLLHGVSLAPTRLLTLSAHARAITACAVTPSGDLLSASDDGALRIWALSSGECAGELRGHRGSLTGCDVSCDGRWAISTSTDGTAALWDLATRTRVDALDGGGPSATACAVSHASEQFVVGWDDGTLTLWNRAAAARRVTLAAHDGYVTACVVTPRGMVVSASRDHTVRVWDPCVGEYIHTFERPKGVASSGALEKEDEEEWFTALALLPEGNQVLAAAGDGLITLWDLASGRCERHFGAGQGRVDSCALVHDGVHLLCGMADGDIVVWDVFAGQRILHIKAHEGAVAACTATPDGRRIVPASQDRSIRVWELGLAESFVPQHGHEAPVVACAISPDGRSGVSASKNGLFKIWDVATGMCRATFQGHAEAGMACAISEDGRLVLSRLRDGRISAWSLESRGPWVEPARNLSKRERALLEVPDFGDALTPDGRHAIVARRDGTLEVRNAVTKTLVRELRGHRQQVIHCRVSMDGKRVISVSEDRTLRVFNLETSQCLGTLLGTSWFRCVAAVEDRICAGDEDGNVWMIIDGTHKKQLEGDRLAHEEKCRLRDLLAKLYASERASRVFIRDLGLDEIQVDLRGNPKEFWSSILGEILKQDLLERAVTQARRDYPADSILRAIAESIGIK